MDEKNRKLWLNLTIVTIAVFVSVYIGLRFVSGNQMSAQNILALLGFSLILGFVSSILYLLDFRPAYYIFSLGLLIGLIQMYRTFFMDLDGWEDLSGLAYLFTSVLIGLGAGLIVQLCFYLYKKFKRVG